MQKVKYLVIGAGGRGSIYARHISELSDKAEIAGVAEPRDFFRERVVREHHIPENRCFRDWHEILPLGKIADAVIITTQDRMHLEPALAFAAQGYHILVEKPLSPLPDECRQIAEAARKNNIIMAVCHVLRYSNFTRTLKKLIHDGVIGQVMSVQHLEPVGYWRFAHSYVRGNWRREEDSSTVLLAKSIHDLDWIRFIVDSPCTKISSFGSRMFFRAENKPEGASDRCISCKLEPKCPYYAPRFYVNRIRSHNIGAYVEAVAGGATEESILETLKTSPYGRCVFACDNDVADHQVVNMEFASNATAVFTLAGCSRYGDRRTTVFGSLGELYGDGTRLTYYSYLTGETKQVEIPPCISTDRHGGGDYNLLEAFTQAVQTGDTSKIVTEPDISLETHQMVFAAEISRKEGRTVSMSEVL